MKEFKYSLDLLFVLRNLYTDVRHLKYNAKYSSIVSITLIGN